MNWREKIIVDWPDDLQRNHKARAALADLDRVLLELAGLGHPLHVEEGYVAPPPPGWPRAAFHLYQGARVVNCQADLEELGPDWYPTMEEARHAAGIAKQYQRGGIFDKSLPSSLSQTPQQIQQTIADEAARKEQQKQFVLDLRFSNREAFKTNTITVDHGEEEPYRSVQEQFERIKGRL
jgi:hypothetical protein